jgi:Ras-related GTP-binding protein C/D
MGPRRSGKTSLVRTIFQKMSPHETLFLESTGNVDLQFVSDNEFVRFQTWDFGGDLNLQVYIYIYAVCHFWYHKFHLK